MFKMAARASNENGKRGRGTRGGGLSYVNVTLPDVRGRGVCECVSVCWPCSAGQQVKCNRNVSPRPQQAAQPFS